MKLTMKQFCEMDETDPLPLSDFPPDFDHAEDPYSYDNDLPDNTETIEEEQETRESWGLK